MASVRVSRSCQQTFAKTNVVVAVLRETNGLSEWKAKGKETVQNTL